MKKVLFTFLLFLIVGFPFSLQAVQPTSKKKITTHSVNVLQKKQKRPFLQRILLKKIQRKIDRKIRKKAKKGNALATKSLGFGVGSILVLGLELFVAVIIPILRVDVFFVLLFVFNLVAFVFGIKGVSNGVQHLKKNRKKTTIQDRQKGNVKASIGILLGTIGMITSAVTFVLGLLLLAYFA